MAKNDPTPGDTPSTSPPSTTEPTPTTNPAPKATVAGPAPSTTGTSAAVVKQPDNSAVPVTSDASSPASEIDALQATGSPEPSPTFAARHAGTNQAPPQVRFDSDFYGPRTFVAEENIDTYAKLGAWLNDCALALASERNGEAPASGRLLFGQLYLQDPAAPGEPDPDPATT